VPATAGHVYTECARIWNPIHTDLAMARAAGLPAPILHGTATLALAISSVVRRDLDGDPTRVAGVAVRFTGMVVPPTTLIVRGRGALGDRLAFDAVGEDGRPVLSAGILWRRGR
jgi:acyl dehydratase